MEKFETIDAYISSFPAGVQERLEEVRKTIRKLVPGAEEAIKYAIPTFVVDGKNLVHFAAFKNHIGFYPAPTGLKAFEKDLEPYKQGKGSVQFPFEEKLPIGLIKKITEYRVGEVKGLKKSKGVR